MAQHVTEDVHHYLEVGSGNFSVVDRQLAVGSRIQASTDAIDYLRDLARRRAPLGPLKTQMFHYMRESGVVSRLIARAGAEVNAHADGSRGRHGRRQHSQSVVKRSVPVAVVNRFCHRPLVQTF